MQLHSEWGKNIVQTSNTISLSQLRAQLSSQQSDLLAMTHRGPVTLIEEERIAGVLLSPAQWDAIAKTLRAAQECLAAAEASKRQLQ